MNGTHSRRESWESTTKPTSIQVLETLIIKIPWSLLTHLLIVSDLCLLNLWRPFSEWSLSMTSIREKLNESTNTPKNTRNALKWISRTHFNHLSKKCWSGCGFHFSCHYWRFQEYLIPFVNLIPQSDYLEMSILTHHNTAVLNDDQFNEYVVDHNRDYDTVLLFSFTKTPNDCVSCLYWI